MRDGETTCASVNVLPRQKLPSHLTGQGERVTAIFCGSIGLVAASETAWVHRNTVTALISRRLFDANDPESTGIARFWPESLHDQSPCDTTKDKKQPHLPILMSR
jgi:hypothetical protein